MARRSGSRQVWHLHEHMHEVEARGVLRRRVAWYVDGALVGHAVAWIEIRRRRRIAGGAVDPRSGG